MRFKKHGDAALVGKPGVQPGTRERDANPNWRGEAIGYEAAHARVEADRGRACEHSCIDCGGRAENWSYDHADPNELRNARGLPYSPHTMHYAPRCLSCHARFDRNA